MSNIIYMKLYKNKHRRCINCNAEGTEGHFLCGKCIDELAKRPESYIMMDKLRECEPATFSSKVKYLTAEAFEIKRELSGRTFYIFADESVIVEDCYDFKIGE